MEDEAEGFEITYFPVLECVLIDPELLKKALRPDTGLVSIFMTCKTEMGVIQPIERMCQDQENVIPLDVIVMNIEKCPKDVRMLYVRTGYVPASTLSPLERDLMSGL